MVASLAEHAHLFAEHGCFGGRENGEGKPKKIHVDCHDKENARGGENLSALPEDFKPLKLDETMNDAWKKLLLDNGVGAAKDSESQ
jgi:hypothetical protein